MMFPSIFYLPFLLLPVVGQSTYSKSVCYTKFGSKSINPLPSATATKATTLTAVRITVIVPKTTKTPSPNTSTVIQDVTTTVTSTAPQETDTFHTTVTIDTTTTSLFSETFVSTNFAQTTITTGDGTSTVTTNAGQTPVQSVSGNPPSRKRGSGHARRIAAPVVTDAAASLETRKSKQVLCAIQDHKPYIPRKYPAAVACTKNIKVITTKTLSFTWLRTATKTAPSPTITTTSIRSHTVTTVVTPVRASTTITEFTTNTFSTSSTTTYTSTTATTTSITVAVIPTATAYPGCSQDNFISSRNGRGIQVVYQSDSNSYAQTLTQSTPSALECCHACFDRPDCGGTAFYGGYCFLFIATTCQPTSVLGKYSAPDDFDSPGYVVSNGNCGRLQWDQQP
ncbi:hypothetical protein PMIN04_008547 [Paraphaeosphaeria minitans]